MKIGNWVRVRIFYVFINFSDHDIEELLLDFRELHGEHSGENLAAAVWATLKLYGLKGRVSN